MARRLSELIVGRNIHMARSRNRKILSGLCTQRKGASANCAVIQQLKPQKYCHIFKNEVHLAANLRFYLFQIYKSSLNHYKAWSGSELYLCLVASS